MKTTLTTLLLLVLSLAGFAQGDTQSYQTIAGIVSDAKSGKEVAYASVVAGSQSTVTNANGRFSVKVHQVPDELRLSSVGYKSQRVSLKDKSLNDLVIKLQPTSVTLSEVTVWADTPENILHAAMAKIPDNYSKRPELLHSFYRETVQKGRRFIHVCEGVADIYEAPYSGYPAHGDAVAILKGRRIISPKPSDTLSAKILGGPVMSVNMDLVKNDDMLLSEQELRNYRLTLEKPEKIGDRLHYVISLTPAIATAAPYPLYYGKLYIDQQRLSFTRAELRLDMSDADKVSSFILFKKPLGLRFKPKEVTTLITYETDTDNITRISYVCNQFRFKCDWRRRLFSSTFTATAEMVITSHEDGEGKRIKGRSSFGSRDAFFDKVSYFADPDFWGSHTIIEPTESLEKAITKLKKMNTQ